jgi:3-deoxy-D-manno-octulosonate 8-phosphate phosphatase (KDO 8-P phosphatase)
MDLSSVRLLILDVDGVLTDGRVAFGAEGEVGKSFQVRDGCAIKLWQACGQKVAVLSGRESGAVAHRAAELGIDCVHAGTSNKLAGYQAILEEAGCTDAETVYVGDDLPDLGPMRRAGFAVAVANAAPDVKRIANYVTRRGGGDGAVAEVIEFVLRKQKRWTQDLLAGV